MTADNDRIHNLQDWALRIMDVTDEMVAAKDDALSEAIESLRDARGALDDLMSGEGA